MNIKDQLKNMGVRPDPSKDQFFLTDENILSAIVDFAELNASDTVLEIGAGIGNLTRLLSEKAGRVISFEIDQRYKAFLDKLPKNVEIHYENAWEYIQLRGKYRKKKEYNKVVSNLPYSFTEQFLHNLTFLDYDKVILLVPAKIVRKINENPVFGSFFKSEVILNVAKEKFYPSPRTNSILINLVKLADPLKNRNIGLFLRQYMYQREDKLVKNSLMEGLVDYTRLTKEEVLTKNEARQMIAEVNIPKELLDKHPNNPEVYDLVGGSFKDIKN